MRIYSDEELKKKAEAIVVKYLLIVQNLVESAVKELGEEDAEKFMLYFIAASGRGMTAVDEDSEIKYDDAVDIMKMASEAVYGT